jgi:hypothetical protein
MVVDRIASHLASSCFLRPSSYCQMKDNLVTLYYLDGRQTRRAHTNKRAEHNLSEELFLFDHPSCL